MIDVARFAARTIGVAYVTMISTLSRTNSEANSAARSLLPSAQRYSMTKLRPSVQPSSRSRCKKAATQRPWAAGTDTEPKNPMVGSLPGCCARAPSGHATAAPPSSVMNSRRVIRSASSMRTLLLQSFCDDVSHGRAGRPAQLQDAGNRQPNDDESADEHTDRGQSAFTGETGFAHSGRAA